MHRDLMTTFVPKMNHQIHDPTTVFPRPHRLSMDGTIYNIPWKQKQNLNFLNKIISIHWCHDSRAEQKKLSYWNKRNVEEDVTTTNEENQVKFISSHKNRNWKCCHCTFTSHYTSLYMDYDFLKHRRMDVTRHTELRTRV